MKKICAFILLSMLFVNYSFGQTKKYELSAIDFAAKIKATPNAIILDVRTPEEFVEGHLAHAVNMDWTGDYFDKQAAKLDKAKPIFVYCYSGGRSEEAAKHLRDNGFKEVYEMSGGMAKWRKAHLPEVK